MKLPSPPRKKGSLSFISILISFSCLLILAVSLRDKIPSILALLNSTDKRFMLLAVLFLFLNHVLIASRLLIVLNSQKINLPFLEGLKIYFSGIFFGNFVPWLGGGLTITYLISKKTNKPISRIYSNIFFDGFLSSLTAFIFPIMLILILGRKIDFFIPAPALVFFLVIFLSVIVLIANEFYREHPFSKNLEKKFKILNHFFDGIKNAKSLIKNRPLVSANAAMTVISVGLLSAGFYFIIKSLSAQADFMYILICIPIINVLSKLPSISGLGLREMGYLYFFKHIIGIETAAAMMVLILACRFAFCFLGFVVFSLNKEHHF